MPTSYDLIRQAERKRAAEKRAIRETARQQAMHGFDDATALVLAKKLARKYLAESEISQSI